MLAELLCCKPAGKDVSPALEVNLVASVTIQLLDSLVRLPTQIPPVKAILINLFHAKGFEMSGSARQGTRGSPKALTINTQRKVFLAHSVHVR